MNLSGPRPLRTYLGWALLIAGIGAAGAGVIAPFALGPQRLQLQQRAMIAASGHSFTVEVPTDRRKVFRPARDIGAFYPSPMRLLEDGQSVGIPVFDFKEASKGAGRFAYKHPTLSFSTRDGTDPRFNGRTYALERPIAARAVVWWSAILSIVIGLALAFPGAMRSIAVVVLRDPVRSQSTPRIAINAVSPVAGYAALLLITLVSCAVLFSMWLSGRSAELGVAGFLPVSDAFGYYGCALSISAREAASVFATVSDWCARRMLYPSMLSTLLGLTAWHPSIALLAQACLIGLSIGTLALALQRRFGWLCGLLTATAMITFADEFAIGNFMTESLGLVAGALGLALLLLSASRPFFYPARATSGLALLSLAMVIRPGAVFILPLLGVWFFLASGALPCQQRVRSLIAALVALASGPLLHYALLLSAGADPSNSGGNYAVSLYSLATGSRDWSQAYRDFAQAFGTQSETAAFRLVQQEALRRIADDPATFIGSLIGAEKSFLQSLFAFGPFRSYNTLATSLFCLGGLLCAFNIRKVECSLLLTVCVGEIISAPFVYDSGYQRVFAVSVAARAALAAYAIAWIAGLPVKEAGALQSANEHQRATSISLSTASIVFGIALFLLAVLPLTPLTRFWRLEAFTPAADGCSFGQRAIVVRSGHETMRMTFGDFSLPVADEQLGSTLGRLELDPIARRAWWATHFQPSLGTQVVYAVERRPQNLGSIVPAFSAKPLLLPNQGFVTLCLRLGPSEMKLGDHQLFEVVDVIR